VVIVCSFCIAFECHIFFLFGSVFEVTDGRSIEENEVNNKWETENYSGTGKESSCVAK
jgi:hypothetical protein